MKRIFFNLLLFKLQSVSSNVLLLFLPKFNFLQHNYTKVLKYYRACYAIVAERKSVYSLLNCILGFMKKLPS